LTAEVKAKFTEKLAADPYQVFGRKVTEIVCRDGLKLILGDGSRVIFRLPGVESVVRMQAEARTPEDLETLSAAAKQWISE
jgi:phosphomannomutase